MRRYPSLCDYWLGTSVSNTPRAVNASSWFSRGLPSPSAFVAPWLARYRLTRAVQRGGLCGCQWFVVYGHSICRQERDVNTRIQGFSVELVAWDTNCMRMRKMFAVWLSAGCAGWRSGVAWNRCNPHGERAWWAFGWFGGMQGLVVDGGGVNVLQWA